MEGDPHNAKEDLFISKIINTLTTKGKKKDKVQQIENCMNLASGSTPQTSKREAKLMFNLRKFIKKSSTPITTKKWCALRLSMGQDMAMT